MSESPPDNPYEAPQTVGQAPPRQPQPPVSFATLAMIYAAIGLGIVSFIPWIGIACFVLSIPVLVRWSRQGGPRPKSSQLVKNLTQVGLFFSVLAAAIGAFWGTCHTSGFGMTIAISDSRFLNYLPAIVIIATCIGGVAAVVTLRKLWPLMTPKYRLEETHERSNRNNVQLPDAHAPPDFTDQEEA